MSIQSEINRLTTAKTNIASAITSKGVSVPSTASLSDMSSYISQISEGGDVTITKVWENSSKTASFAAQTLNLGLGSYDMYMVIARYSDTIGGSVVAINKTGYSCRLQGVTTDSDTQKMSYRTVTYSSGSLNIGTAYLYQSSSNINLIPIFVYGIKGVS